MADPHPAAATDSSDRGTSAAPELLTDFTSETPDLGWYVVDNLPTVVVAYVDGRPVGYDFLELDELTLAYAISVHKSQGSEYPAVVVPVMTQHYTLSEPNVIYTALTRGKNLVVFIGTPKALAIAVKNDVPRKRLSRLAERVAADEGLGLTKPQVDF